MRVISLGQKKNWTKASWNWIKLKLENSCRIWVVIRYFGRRIHQLGITLMEFGKAKLGQQVQYWDQYLELMDPVLMMKPWNFDNIGRDNSEFQTADHWDHYRWYKWSYHFTFKFLENEVKSYDATFWIFWNTVSLQ